MKTQAIVLLSGGLDSATALGLAVVGRSAVEAVTVRYGQRHSREFDSACKLAEYYDVPLHVVDLGIKLNNSALTNKNVAVPVGRAEDQMTQDVPVTYVPGRNTMFLSMAMSIAEDRGSDWVYTGVNAVDYSGYPDCRPEYVHAMNMVGYLSSKKATQEGRPIQIHAPLIKMTKEEIIKTGVSIGVPYELTWSCYNGGEKPCHVCDSCIIREAAFKSLGTVDPLNN